MKIGIDISQVIYQTGVSRYTSALIKNLQDLDKSNQYILFFSSLRQEITNYQLPITNKNFQIKKFKFPPTFLDILWNKLHIVNIETLVGKLDVFHSSDWIQPPTEARKITTVHDVSFLRFPQFFPEKIIKTHRRRLYWVKKEVDLVMTDSQSTKKDLINFLGFNPNKVKVVYLGVEERFKIDKDKERNKIQAVLAKYNINREYILTVATQEPRKNINMVIEAFSQLPEKLCLVLAGKPGWGKAIKQTKSVLLPGFVSDQDLPYLYAGAKCFVYPSRWEGFGLPVLEAMACGCPVITSDNSSLQEISGQAALLVDPENKNELVNALKKITQNKSLVKKLTSLGKNQASKFTWAKTAREVLACYQQCL